jgi:hypothetical protein
MPSAIFITTPPGCKTTQKNGTASSAASKKGYEMQSLSNSQGKLPLFALMFCETFMTFTGTCWSLCSPLPSELPRSLVTLVSL